MNLLQAKQKLAIVVILGGHSKEREISLQSGDAIYQSLKKQQFNVDLFDPKCDNYQILHKYDLAFIMLHGKDGEDGKIQALLELFSVSYIGSDVLASATCLNKARTKEILFFYGIKTPKFTLLKKKEIDDKSLVNIVKYIGKKMFIKPNQEGSSIGIRYVETIEALKAGLTEAFTYDDDVLIEEYIEGREYSVPIVGKSVLPAIEIQVQNGFYDYVAKYFAKDTQYYCPTTLSPVELDRLNQIAWSIFDILGCRDLGRVDFILDSHNEWYFLEVNTIPGMTSTSLLPKSAKVLGLSFDDLVLHLLELGMCR